MPGPTDRISDATRRFCSPSELLTTFRYRAPPFSFSFRPGTWRGAEQTESNPTHNVHRGATHEEASRRCHCSFDCSWPAPDRSHAGPPFISRRLASLYEVHAKGALATVNLVPRSPWFPIKKSPESVVDSISEPSEALEEHGAPMDPLEDSQRDDPISSLESRLFSPGHCGVQFN